MAPHPVTEYCIMPVSPFDLDNQLAYRRWAAAKRASHPTHARDLVVNVGDPRTLSDAEVQALLQRCAGASMAIYRSAVRVPDKDIPRLLGQQMGLFRLDGNWLADEDVYVCPAGERLRRVGRMEATHRVRYQAPAGVCQGCPFRPQCAPPGRPRSLHRQFVQDLIEAAGKRTASPLGKRRLRERQVRVEGIFALAKELHGLRRTRFRGTARVQIQLWMTAAAMNIKRAARPTARRASVSYTHLQAHETVLDLVCRLLLEKKKDESVQARFYPGAP